MSTCRVEMDPIEGQFDVVFEYRVSWLLLDGGGETVGRPNQASWIVATRTYLHGLTVT